jgi:hypothetical protein
MEKAETKLLPQFQKKIIGGGSVKAKHLQLMQATPSIIQFEILTNSPYQLSVTFRL